MQIALLTEYSQIGGGESNLLNLVEQLSKSNEVTLFCSGFVQERAKQKGIKTIEFKTGKRWIGFIPYIDFSLYQTLQSFDVIHAYSLNALPFLVGVKPPVVWTVHGFWEKPFGIRSFLINKLVDKVICVSKDVCERASFPVSKKQIIHLGTDFEISSTLNLKNDNVIRIVCVARFQWIKGQDLLLKAVQNISKKLHSNKIELVFVGSVNGDNNEDIEYYNRVYSLSENIISDNLTVVFEGYRPDVRPFIENSNFVVIPSHYESFSMVAIEAISCGKPIIAPCIGGPKEIVISNKIGLLFKPKRLDSLEEKIIYAINNYERFDRELIHLRAKDFSVDTQAKKHIELYKGVIQ